MAGLTPFYAKANASTYLRFNLDKTIYDSDVAAATGLLQTEPPAGTQVIDLSQKQARRSNAVGRVMLSCTRGKKFRRVPLLCDREKLNTIEAALRNKTIQLGLGAGVPWNIDRIGSA